MSPQTQLESWNHPELINGEVLLRNMTQSEFDRLEFSTKRQGQTAYDGEGKLLHHQDWLPVFIGEKELSHRELALRSLRQQLR